MNKITEDLFKLQDLIYRDFYSKLVPNLDNEFIIGVRTPDLKRLAKEIFKSGDYYSFIQSLPHKYYDEYQLHSFIISQITDYETVLFEVNKLLPYIDNWATCDQLNPTIFKKNRNILIYEVLNWLKSTNTYTVRFGIVMMMRYYLDNDFKAEYLQIISDIKSDEYYINMAIAWYFATALSKQYETTLPYLTENKLDVWVHNKTIQKARESFKISAEQKEYLKSLKR